MSSSFRLQYIQVSIPAGDPVASINHSSETHPCLSHLLTRVRVILCVETAVLSAVVSLSMAPAIFVTLLQSLTLIVLLFRHRGKLSVRLR